MKNKIVIKTNYKGEDKERIKKGDPMRIICPKKETLAEYMDVNIRREFNHLEPISLLTFLRQKVDRISQHGSVYVVF